MSTAKDFDPDMPSQINLNKAPDNEGGCMTADDLNKYLDIDKFNDMMADATQQATDFLTNFQKEQAAVPRVVSDDRYRITAMNKLRELRDEHNNLMNRLRREETYYNASIEGAENTKSLFRMIEKQNLELKKMIEKLVHNIEISDRKTYYENEQNDWAGWWAHHLMTKYWLLIFLMIVGLIITKQFTDIKKWGMIIGLAIYPLIAFFILKIMYHFWDWIKSQTTWVYLSSNL
jgi:hypothetical protein